MNLRSEAVLSFLCPALADRIRAASDTLNHEATCILAVTGLRTAAEQDALYAQGRTTPGHVVTEARFGFSMHNYGLAVDLVPYLSGSAGPLNWNRSTVQFQRMITVLKARGLAWGGDWQGSLGDFDHFQLASIPASPTLAMRIDYYPIAHTTHPDYTTIWHKAISGLYLPQQAAA